MKKIMKLVTSLLLCLTLFMGCSNKTSDSKSSNSPDGQTTSMVGSGAETTNAANHKTGGKGRYVEKSCLPSIDDGVPVNIYSIIPEDVPESKQGQIGITSIGRCIYQQDDESWKAENIKWLSNVEEPFQNVKLVSGKDGEEYALTWIEDFTSSQGTRGCIYKKVKDHAKKIEIPYLEENQNGVLDIPYGLSVTKEGNLIIRI